MMGVKELIDGARDALTVTRVFGEPYERDGVTVIPAAKVRGGAGGGGAESPERHEHGGGSGFGLIAAPVGAYVIRDGRVHWEPALDLNRIIVGGQILALAAILAWRSSAKARQRRKRLQLRRSA